MTLPPAVYEAVMAEASRRKVGGERNPGLSAVIGEAVVAHLSG